MATENFAYSKRVFLCDEFLFKARNRVFLQGSVKDL